MNRKEAVDYIRDNSKGLRDIGSINNRAFEYRATNGNPFILEVIGETAAEVKGFQIYFASKQAGTDATVSEFERYAEIFKTQE